MLCEAYICLIHILSTFTDCLYQYWSHVKLEYFTLELTVTFAIGYCLSVCLSSVCNGYAPYSGD